MKINPSKDAMGAAILDFQKHGKADRLRVLSTMFDEDEMPVVHLFRTEKEMPILERKALPLARGKVLDVGAGAGCHALALQNKGINVKAIDISPLSCEAMRMRGIRDVECIDIFDPRLEGKYDTILLLMNGTGIAGKVQNLPRLLKRLNELLSPGGQILIDSSDLKYLFEDDDLEESEVGADIDMYNDGEEAVMTNDVCNEENDENYYGEVDYQMIYKDVVGEPFEWLYTDFALLRAVAETCGMTATLIAEGEHYDYLACIK